MCRLGDHRRARRYFAVARGGAKYCTGGKTVAEPASVALEGREDDAALVRLVMVMEQVLGHAAEPAVARPRGHQGGTLIRHP